MCYCLIQQAAPKSTSGSSFVINLYVNFPVMLKIVAKIFLHFLEQSSNFRFCDFIKIAVYCKPM